MYEVYRRRRRKVTEVRKYFKFSSINTPENAPLNDDPSTASIRPIEARATAAICQAGRKCIIFDDIIFVATSESEKQFRYIYMSGRWNVWDSK
jgi:hypothetical protein